MSCHMKVSLVFVSQPKNNNKHILNITNNATQNISYEKQRLVSERKVYASQKETTKRNNIPCPKINASCIPSKKGGKYKGK